jgi:glycosyltransferase involved in cell wall biosynthesis
MLTRITDGFIAVAKDHARYQVEQERFPAEKVFMIPNGIDTDRFQFDADKRSQWRARYDIPAEAPVVGIVAALRSEKNHSLFVDAAAKVLQQRPDTHFVIAGEGPERATIEARIAEHQISASVHMLGSIDDIPGVLSMTDVFALTSHNEASPVSILEALSCQRPVVAPNVGSIHESVLDDQTGYLVPAGDLAATAERWLALINHPELRQRLGASGRDHVVENGSLASMTEGYLALVESIYSRKKPLVRQAHDSSGSSAAVLPVTLSNGASSGVSTSAQSIS